MHVSKFNTTTNLPTSLYNSPTAEASNNSFGKCGGTAVILRVTYRNTHGAKKLGQGPP